MRLPKKDIVATCLVAVAGLVYLLWALDATLLGLDDTRVAGAAVLGLGFVASASAVVPTFDALMRGNKVYLAATSLIGLIAFVGGLSVLLSESGVGFSVLTVSMIVLWIMTTAHHVMLAGNAAAGVATVSDKAAPQPPARGHLTARH